MARKLNWYGVRGLQDSGAEAPPKHRIYAESIILVRAASNAEAKRKAKKIFRKAEFKFLGELESSELFDDPKAGHEVFWTVRMSVLSPKEYVKEHWDDGRPNSCRGRNWQHQWHNVDNKVSACYWCHERRPGQLWRSKK